MTHPVFDDLFEAVPCAETLQHLEECARCRVERMLALGESPRARSTFAPPTPALRLDETALMRVRIPSRFTVNRWLRRSAEVREVFAALDGRSKRTVGVVVLHETSDQVEERLRELADVDPPCAERILEILRTDDALLYTTELVEGTTLDATGGPSGLLDWTDVARSVAAALATLHGRGLVHGNVTTSSIRLRSTGEVTLVDPDPMPGRIGPAEDWRALAQALRDWVSDEDEAALEFAEVLEQGSANENAVLIRLLGATRSGHAQRYQALENLGRGGMGEVDRVRDPVLDRRVALKVIHHSRNNPHEIDRFFSEARLTAQLEHPTVPPVHEVGRMGDGRPYFTMKEIPQRSLLDELRRVHDVSTRTTWGTTDEGWTLRRLVEALMKAAEGVAFAHSRGVINRDLKPQHILLGEFGEVYVLDWGLAKIYADWDEDDDAISDTQEEPVRAYRTVMGARVGTVGFMPSEQDGGDPMTHGPASDVFALGRTLLAILDGGRFMESASDTENGDAPHRAFSDDGPPPAPAALLQLIEQATRENIEDRPVDATAFVDELRRWLSGAERRERALARLATVDRQAASIERARTRADELRTEAAELLHEVQPHDPIECKREAWARQDQATDWDRKAEAFGVDYVSTLRSALEVDPSLEEARALLLDYYRSEFERAERAHDTRAITRYRQHLEADPTERHHEWLASGGTVSLVTDPPGATVYLRPWNEHERHLVAGPREPLGHTPLTRIKVPQGSFLLEIEAPGRAVVRYPIAVARDEHWHGVAPGEQTAHPIWLPSLDELDEDDCYVPAGWFEAGGDPLAIDGLPRRRIWVPGFVIKRFAVTHEDFVEFLNATDSDRARAFSPKVNRSSTAPLYEMKRGQYIIRPSDPADRSIWNAKSPVMLLDAGAASAYAQWRSTDSRRWSLPHELEWEKAARGVDGRPFPWGRFLDPTFTCMQASHGSDQRMADVDSYPIDESPYGVRGLGGNVRDMCINRYRRHYFADDRLVLHHEDTAGPNDERVNRGGSWGSVNTWCRSASRFANRSDFRSHNIGFRLVRRLDPTSE